MLVGKDRLKGKLIDLRGQQFGVLTVIRRYYPWERPGYDAGGYRLKTRQARWVCQCVCGEIKIRLSQNLRKGDHKCRCRSGNGGKTQTVGHSMSKVEQLAS